MQALAIVILGITTTIFAAQKHQVLPPVVSAHTPFYPKIYRAAYITGVVHLQVTTDGERAVSIEKISGPHMLAEAATENIKTWVFEEHEPITFDTTFTYKLSKTECDNSCICQPVEQPYVLLRLPGEVEIRAGVAVICHLRSTEED